MERLPSMDHVLVLRVAGAPPSRHAIGAAVTAGGSLADGILLAGAPAAALRIVRAAAGVVVEPSVAGVRVGGRAVHPGARRLVRPGERFEAAGATLALEPEPVPEATRAAASPVLRGEIAGDGPAVLVLTGPRAGERHALGEGLTAGRGRAASLCLPDPLASRVHLRLRADPHGATVEDLGSKNGVRVNGVPIDDRAFPVRPGDEIALGDTLLALEDPFAGAPPVEAPIRTASAAAAPAGVALPRALAAAALLALSAAALAVAGS